MACAAGGSSVGGGEGPSDNDSFDPPKTPRMVLKEDAQEGELSPDTEDNVAEQTDGIFRNFVYHMQTLGRREMGVVVGAERGAEAEPTRLPELIAFPDQPMS